MTEEQQKDIEQLFEAMGKSGGRFVIGQVIGSQTNFIGDKFAQKNEETSNQEAKETFHEEQDCSTTLSDSRQDILNRLQALADKGDWKNGVTADAIKIMMQQVLQKSETLWKLLERGRGDRVRIVWQNLIGYFIDRKILPTTIGAPALNKMFFDDENGYTNIDKGRPSKRLMTADFESLVPLLDADVPKVESDII